MKFRLLGAALFMLSWSITTIAADEVGAVVPAQVEEHHLVPIKLSKGEFISISAFTDKFIQVDAVKTYSGVVFTGPPGRYQINVFNRNDEEPLPVVHYVTIVPAGPVPVPPPGPTPPPPGPVVPVPEGFAGEVFTEARKVNDRPNCLQLANNYKTVASNLSTGRYKELSEAQVEIVRMNKALGLGASWKPFGMWIGAKANEKAQTIITATKFFDDVANGLGAAAK